MSAVAAEPAAALEIDGAALECRWFGRPHPRRVIVMLHEGLGSLAMWRDFPMRLAAASGWPVFAYSRQGYGGSAPLQGDRDPGYMHREGLEVLPALLSTAGIETPVLFGHSDGASIGLIYGSRFPEQVRGLILEAPHVFVETLTVSSIAAIGASYEASAMGARLGRYHHDADAAFWGWNRIWLDPRFRSWNIESGLETIQAPTFLIQGDDDEYGTVEQLARIRSRIGQAATLMLPHCGHAPHRDNPPAVIAAATALLRTLDQGPLS